MIRTELPIAVGVKLVLNFARTTPFVPCERVTLPHTTRNFDPAFATFAL